MPSLIEIETEEVLSSVTGGVATITVNRPKQRNALSIAPAGRVTHMSFNEKTNQGAQR